jgi:hypothetical protein
MLLKDSLPADLKGIRVLIYGYNMQLSDSRSFQDLEALASTFPRLLLLMRRQSTICGSTFFKPIQDGLATHYYYPAQPSREVPMFFIAHSLNGIVLKEVWAL